MAQDNKRLNEKSVIIKMSPCKTAQFKDYFNMRKIQQDDL